MIELLNIWNCELKDDLSKMSVNEKYKETDWSINNDYRRKKWWKKWDNYVIITQILIQPNRIINQGKNVYPFFRFSWDQKRFWVKILFFRLRFLYDKAINRKTPVWFPFTSTLQYSATRFIAIKESLVFVWKTLHFVFCWWAFLSDVFIGTANIILEIIKMVNKIKSTK